MQRRRGISEDELNKVIKLKEAGLSWLKIQEESSVPRRSAKLAYEKWQKSQSFAELKVARVSVAAEIFKGHIQALIDLAGYITSRLTIPSSTQLTATQFLDSLLEQEIGNQNIYGLPQTNDRHRSKSVLRHNRLLFKALQDHTKEKIRWESLKEWKMAWDKLIESFGEIREFTSTLVDKEFKKREKLLQSIREDSGNQDAVACIVDTIVNTIFQDIIENNLRTNKQVIEITSDNVLSTHVITSRKDNKSVFIFKDETLAKEVLEIFRSIDTQVRVLNILAGVEDEINRIHTVIKELDEMLSPIILYPILLRTRCDFCPV